MKKWYVIQIKSKQENMAIENLLNQGFESYNPIQRKVSIFRGKEKVTIAPLFSGYMFVCFDIIKDNWKAIAHTKGVYKILTATNTNCSALPKGFVESLKKREDVDGNIVTGNLNKMLRKFLPGDKLVINGGAFKGSLGVCESVKKDNVILLFSLLQGENKVELHKNYVSHTDLD